MSLDDLKKKIYNPEENLDKRTKKPASFQVGKKGQKREAEKWEDHKKPKKPKFKLSSEVKKKIKTAGIIAIVLFLLGAGFLIWRGMTSFDKDKVDLSIDGVKRVVSGDETRYIVKYKNNTRLKLENIKLTFYYPEDSVVIGGENLIQSFELPDLAAQQESKVELPVRVVGLKGEIKEAQAELSYNPKGVSSEFVNKASFKSEIFSVPLSLNFNLPSSLVESQQFDFSLYYSNQADISFKDLVVKIDYPTGFKFNSASPVSSSGQKIWQVEDLDSGDEYRILIRGNIEGDTGESKKFKAEIGREQNGKFIPIAEAVDALQISTSPLAISQTVNKSTDYIAQAGETLDYEINYQNTTDVNIQDITITAKLEGEVFDLSSIETENGSLKQENTIIWKTSNLSDLEYLEPNEEGSVEFSVNIKQSLPIENYTDKNFIASNSVEIDSSKKPLSLKDIEIKGSDKLDTKIATDLQVSSQAFYNDDILSGSGPLPPKVGEKTTYTIKWRLVNTSNDLSEVKVESFLPPHVTWEDKIVPANSDIRYLPSSGKLVWHIGDLSAGTGVLSPVKQVVFQVSIEPSSSQIGKKLKLLNKAVAQGKDDFTKQELTSIGSLVNTQLSNDPTVSKEESEVVK